MGLMVPRSPKTVLHQAPQIDSNRPYRPPSPVKNPQLNLNITRVKRDAHPRPKSPASFASPLQHHICAIQHWGVLASYRQRVTSRATSWAIIEHQSHVVSERIILLLIFGFDTDWQFAGHCRRRKIRCLLASDNPQGRCSNCIRLKKECNFYPVEHNPDVPQSQAGSSKPGSSAQPSTPATTSPGHPLPPLGEARPEFRTPFSGPTAQPSSYGYQGEPEIDPHHAPTSSGRECVRCFETADANATSTITTVALPLPPSNRNSVATSKQLPTILHCSRKSFVATLTFNSELCIR
jgi:hypothetical protein